MQEAKEKLAKIQEHLQNLHKLNAEKTTTDLQQKINNLELQIENLIKIIKQKDDKIKDFQERLDKFKAKEKTVLNKLDNISALL